MIDSDDLRYILCVHEHGIEEVILGNHKFAANFLIILLGQGVNGFGALESLRRAEEEGLGG